MRIKKNHTRHDVIVFAIRDYANDLPTDPFSSDLWGSADDLADFIEKRLDSDSLT